MWISAGTAVRVGPNHVWLFFQRTFKYVLHAQLLCQKSSSSLCCSEHKEMLLFFLTPVIKSRIFVNSPSMNTSRMQHDSQMSLYGLLTFNHYSSPILISNLMPNMFYFCFLVVFFIILPNQPVKENNHIKKLLLGFSKHRASRLTLPDFMNLFPCPVQRLVGWSISVKFMWSNC